VFIRKWWILPEFKAGGKFKPEKYIDDLSLPPNAEIG
jgi:hypothetical protein